MGTYEARPGAGAADYTNPSPDYHPGSYQGDGPTGTLTSETFTIGGSNKIQVGRIPRMSSFEQIDSMIKTSTATVPRQCFVQRHGPADCYLKTRRSRTGLTSEMKKKKTYF